MKNIVVDIDGCVCQYDFPRLIKKHFGMGILPEWVWCYSLQESLGLPKNAVNRMFEEEAYKDPAFLPDALRVLERMVQGNNVYILSHRENIMGRRDFKVWLGRHHIPHTQIISCKTLPSHVHVAIDDYPTKLLEVASKTNVEDLLLLVQPWNVQCRDLLNWFTWVESWKQIEEELYGKV